jgi:hypothetical protein
MELYFNEILKIDETISKLRLDIYESWFEGEKRKMVNRFYALSPSQRLYWTLLNQLIELSEFFGIEHLDLNKKALEIWMNGIENPPISYEWTKIDTLFTNVKNVFDVVKPELNLKISLLDNEEKERLNEAFNCYLQELNYSAIVMSVSAIESRLFSLMMSKQSNKRLEKLTLGALITEYLENDENYEYVIPEKHLPLLQYCNNYRIFSVHPKKEKITRSNATAILCMTCSFLFDKNMKVEVEGKNS